MAVDVRLFVVDEHHDDDLPLREDREQRGIAWLAPGMTVRQLTREVRRPVDPKSMLSVAEGRQVSRLSASMIFPENNAHPQRARLGASLATAEEPSASVENPRHGSVPPARPAPTPGGEQLDGLPVAWPQQSEVSPGQGSELRFVQSHDHREDGGVDESDVRVRINVARSSRMRA